MARTIHSPKAGEKITIRMDNTEQTLQFDEVIRSATPERSGNDLTFSFDDGGQITLTDFFVSTANELPEVLIGDGVGVPAAEFLSAMAPNMDLTTAAGPASSVDGSGTNYDDNSGALIDGLDRLGSLGTFHWDREVEYGGDDILGLADGDFGFGMTPPPPPDEPVIPPIPPTMPPFYQAPEGRLVMFFDKDSTSSNLNDLYDAYNSSKGGIKAVNKAQPDKGEKYCPETARGYGDVALDSDGKLVFTLNEVGRDALQALQTSTDPFQSIIDYATFYDANGKEHTIEIVLTYNPRFPEGIQSVPHSNPTGYEDQFDIKDPQNKDFEAWYKGTGHKYWDTIKYETHTTEYAQDTDNYGLNKRDGRFQITSHDNEDENFHNILPNPEYYDVNGERLWLLEAQSGDDIIHVYNDAGYNYYKYDNGKYNYKDSDENKDQQMGVHGGRGNDQITFDGKVGFAQITLDTQKVELANKASAQSQPKDGYQDQTNISLDPSRLPPGFDASDDDALKKAIQDAYKDKDGGFIFNKGLDVSFGNGAVGMFHNTLNIGVNPSITSSGKDAILFQSMVMGTSGHDYINILGNIHGSELNLYGGMDYIHIIGDLTKDTASKDTASKDTGYGTGAQSIIRLGGENAYEGDDDTTTLDEALRNILGTSANTTNEGIDQAKMANAGRYAEDGTIVNDPLNSTDPTYWNYLQIDGTMDQGQIHGSWDADYIHIGTVKTGGTESIIATSAGNDYIHINYLNASTSGNIKILGGQGNDHIEIGQMSCATDSNISILGGEGNDILTLNNGAFNGLNGLLKASPDKITIDGFEHIYLNMGDQDINLKDVIDVFGPGKNTPDYQRTDGNIYSTITIKGDDLSQVDIAPLSNWTFSDVDSSYELVHMDTSGQELIYKIILESGV